MQEKYICGIFKIESIFTLIPLLLKNTKLIVHMFNQIRIRSLNYNKPKYDFLNKPGHFLIWSDLVRDILGYVRGMLGIF